MRQRHIGGYARRENPRRITECDGLAGGESSCRLCGSGNRGVRAVHEVQNIQFLKALLSWGQVSQELPQPPLSCRPAVNAALGWLRLDACAGPAVAAVAIKEATMPHALLVSVPGIGHWTLGWNPHPGCLLAATTAFLQAGEPASPAPWNACTRALAQELLPFPAP